MSQSLEMLREFCNANPEFAFNSGASVTALDLFASANSWALPSDFREFLLRSNGETEQSEGICGGFRFLSIEEIQAIHDDWCYYADNDFADLTATTWYFGESPFYDKSWIPVASLRPRELVMIGVAMNQEYVFSWSVELGPNDMYARGFSNFVDRIAAELLDGDDVRMIDELSPIAG